MKKIVICSSIKFGKEIMEWKDILEDIGFRVTKYPIKAKDDVLPAACRYSSYDSYILHRFV